MKTSELTGIALDWAVAKCEGAMAPTGNVLLIGKQLFIGVGSDIYYGGEKIEYSPSTDWAQGGPIIDREGISTIRCDDDYETDDQGFCTNVPIPVWAATSGQHSLGQSYDEPEKSFTQYESDLTYGPTPLIAAMRCFCCAKLGDEVEIPKELK